MMNGRNHRMKDILKLPSLPSIPLVFFYKKRKITRLFFFSSFAPIFNHNSVNSVEEGRRENCQLLHVSECKIFDILLNRKSQILTTCNVHVCKIIISWKNEGENRIKLMMRREAWHFWFFPIHLKKQSAVWYDGWKKSETSNKNWIKKIK